MHVKRKKEERRLSMTGRWDENRGKDTENSNNLFQKKKKKKRRKKR